MASKFGVVPTLAILDKSITHAELRVLALLCSYADKNGECFPSQSKMAECLGIARENVNRHIQSLHKKGWVRSVQRFRDDGSKRSKMYQIVSDHHMACDTEHHMGSDTEHHINNIPPVNTPPMKNNIPGNDFEIDSTENNLTAEEHEWDIDAFEIWWRAYPRLVNKKKAKIAYMSAMKKTDCATLLRGAEEYARQNRDTSEQYIKKPENWLAEELWDDYQPKVKRYLVGGQVKEMSEELAKEIGATEI